VYGRYDDHGLPVSGKRDESSRRYPSMMLLSAGLEVRWRAQCFMTVTSMRVCLMLPYSCRVMAEMTYPNGAPLPDLNHLMATMDESMAFSRASLPLNKAAAAGDLEQVRQLLLSGADTESQTRRIARRFCVPHVPDTHTSSTIRWQRA
jgi:hypothetical protein